MITTKESKDYMNGDLYKNISEEYKKLFKKIIKSIPRSILVQTLIEMKIIKKDYVTNKITLLEVKKKKLTDLELLKSKKGYGRSYGIEDKLLEVENDTN